MPGWGNFTHGRIPVATIGLLALCVAEDAHSQDVARVTATEARVAPIHREISLTGTVTSPRAAQVSTAIAGRVERIVVDAGDRLAAGDLMLELDSALEDAAVARAAAALELAREDLAEARRRVSEARELVEDRSFPRTELKARESEVRKAQSTVALREAELRREEALLARHQVLAPFSGVVSRKFTEVGEWVDPGTAIAELVATEGLRVDFRAPQEIFASLGENSRVRLELGSAPGEWGDGEIMAAVPVSDGEARTFLLRVGLDSSSGPVAAGMSANGRLLVDAGRQGVVVPRDALLRYPDGRVVGWVVEPSGTVSERVLKLGVAFDGQVEILEGIEAGERIVIRGNELLRQGQAVAAQDVDGE